jgi:hypothetical protein
MATLLHVCADGDTPLVVDHEAVTGTRTYERVADYAHAAPGGLRWLAVHDLAGPDGGIDALSRVPRTRGRAGSGDRTAGVPASDGGDVVATVFTQISPADGWLTGDGVATAAPGQLPAGKAVLSVVMDVEERALDLFHGWYDEEHLPKLVAVPGIDAARRFRAVAGAQAEPGRQRFLALYELAGLDLLDTTEWAEAASMTPRTEQVVPHVAIQSQMYRR